ncbi:MAG: prephenate/arogenate dehydrogenase [Cyanobacteriota bacterium]|nr:prephenate/arogenate dehydrogenase [Cyanobacteriota bacterium]
MAVLWQDRPVGLVGLGLIGGSLGLDLQAQGAQVRAWVHRPQTAERALERGLAQQVSTSPEVLTGCGLVVLALPLDQLMAPAPELVGSLPAGAVVTDVGSVKVPVLALWSTLTPRFVGGHPMAGTAQAGVEAGQRGLFQGRPWVVTPERHTDPEALEAVQQLAIAVGSQPLQCSAEAHDQAVALISHLPVLVSAALLGTADQGATGEGQQLARALASSGFADTTRVGGGNPQLGTLMCRWNRDAVLSALGHYQRELDTLIEALKGEDWPSLTRQLEQAQSIRPPFLKVPG